MDKRIENKIKKYLDGVKGYPNVEKVMTGWFKVMFASKTKHAQRSRQEIIDRLNELYSANIALADWDKQRKKI